MKRLFYVVVIIALPLIIFLQYQNYRRFHPSTDYEYPLNSAVDSKYHDPTVVLDYYETVSQVGTYARYCWAEHGIDVKFPDLEDQDEKAHSDHYQQLIATARYLETKLVQSAAWKGQGFSNEQILQMESGLTEIESKTELLIQNTTVVSKGDQNGTVYEIQKLLKDKGYQLPIDGLYKDSTELCVRLFQEKHKLYPSGVVDRQTLNRLLAE
ncbi:MAG: peptidoglycan-binding domain-containing protein [Bacteroidota bacterium]